MFLAIAALLVHPQIAAQLSSFPADKIAVVEPTASEISGSIRPGEGSLSPAPVAAGVAAAGTTIQPVTEPSRAALPDAPVAESAASAPLALILTKPSSPMTVTVRELRAENRRKQLVWKGLVLASSSAATFDAWTTRHAITTVAGAQELDPLLKPFAGNASLYAAIQVGPLLMDYAGKKMMYSRHSWARHLWWVPQSASFVSSIFCGAHNLSFE